MIQAKINLTKKVEYILNAVKAKHGFKDRSEAVNLIVKEYEENISDFELKPEFIKETKRIRKEKGIPFKNISDLRKQIEG